MSALDLIPAETRAEIRAKDPRIRDDLRMISEAEAAGWTVSFPNDHWHNAAIFTRGDVTVWSTGRDYRRNVLVDGRYSKPTVFASGIDGLRAALKAES